ncbi:hypothetical protein HYC85_014008, partial [Camellia sinensis]
EILRVTTLLENAPVLDQNVKFVVALIYIILAWFPRQLIWFYSEENNDDLLLQFNFVGHLFGPRGNSLKRVKASIECCVLIKGRGSIKDPVQKEMMQGKPGIASKIVDAHLMQAREILEDLLKPVVLILLHLNLKSAKVEEYASSHPPPECDLEKWKNLIDRKWNDSNWLVNFSYVYLLLTITLCLPNIYIYIYIYIFLLELALCRNNQ